MCDGNENAAAAGLTSGGEDGSDSEEPEQRSMLLQPQQSKGPPPAGVSTRWRAVGLRLIGFGTDASLVGFSRPDKALVLSTLL